MKAFKDGDVCKVIHNSTYHEFKIGSYVTIQRLTHTSTGIESNEYIVSQSGKVTWAFILQQDLKRVAFASFINQWINKLC